MNKTIIALLLVVCLTNAFQLDVPQCLQGVADFSKQVKSIVQTAGLERQTLGRFLNNTFEAFQGVHPLMQSCGLDFEIMGTITAYEPKNQEQCFESFANITHMAKELYNQQQNSSISIANIAEYSQFAFDLFKQASVSYKACWLVNKNEHLLTMELTDILEIMQNFKGSVLLKKSYAFLNETIKMTKPIPDLFVDAAGLYNEATQVLPQCGLNYTLPQLNDVETKKYCVKDIESIVRSIKETVNDVKDRNYSDIVQNMMSIFNSTQSIYSKCKIRKPMLQSISSCFNDNKNLFHNIGALISDIKNKQDISVTIPELYNILNSLQPLLDSCGIPIDLHIQLIDFKDLQLCIKDLEGVEKLLVQLKADIEAKKISTLGKDIVAIVREIEDATKQCKGQKTVIIE